MPRTKAGVPGTGVKRVRRATFAHEAALDPVALAREHEAHELQDLARAGRLVRDPRQLPGPRVQYLTAAVSHR